MEKREMVGKRRGRPPHPEALRRRSNITLRIRDETKAALEQQAAKSGRSLSEEAEFRLEQSLRAQGMIDDALDFAFGRQSAGAILLIARVIHEIASSRLSAAGQISIQSSFRVSDLGGWLNDPSAFDAVARGVQALLEELRPDGEIQQPKPTGLKQIDSYTSEVGYNIARSLLAHLSPSARHIPDLGQWGDQIRGRLGADVAERVIRRMKQQPHPGKV